MKTKPTLFLLALPVATGLAAESNRPASAATAHVASAEKVTPGSILAAQIREIADTTDLNAASKHRQIASAVRLAVATALTNVKDPQQAFQILLELSTEAAGAMPEYGHLIADAVAGAGLKLPVLAGRADLIAKLRDAIDAVVAEAGGADSEAAGAEGPGKPARAQSPASGFGGSSGDIIVSPST